PPPTPTRLPYSPLFRSASETAADVATDSAVDTATSAAAETAASVAGGFFGAAKEAVITWVGNNPVTAGVVGGVAATGAIYGTWRSEEHTSELQSRENLV